ncbi:MAG: 3-dehydroquinate synthase II [Candidatus Helarchaeota archaeon]|nr:3-dehydroquinate synthase II [Candidatus Helarchaeota archaeon]
MKLFIIKLEKDWDFVKKIASEAVINGLTNFFTNNSEIANKVREFGSITLYSFNKDLNPDILIIKEEEDHELTLKKEQRIGRYIIIKSKEDEELVIKASKLGSKIVIIKGADWKIIPLENLIADLHKTNTNLIVEVENLSEAKLMLETLELGSDGVLIPLKSIDEIKEIKNLLEESKTIELSIAKVTIIKEVGAGDRVCLDTCSILNIGEGMLIGSQSKGLFLIHSETFDTEFVASRPFRVNAGAVHAYILLPNGKTQYLSEIKAGDEVLIVDSKGTCRKAIIGRSKIEKRPLLLIEAQINDEILKTIVQNAETIRLVNKDQKAISVSKLKVGDEILVFYKHGGRHFGKLVADEFIIEK